MAKTISELKAQSAEVKNASAIGENTATRVGQLFGDIVEHVEQYENAKDTKDASQDTTMQSLVSAEESRAKGEERGLTNYIHAEEINRQTADAYLSELITNETSARATADDNIRTALNNEITRAKLAEQELAAAEVWTNRIQDGAVTTSKLADGAVTYEKTNIIAQELSDNEHNVPSSKVVKANIDGLAQAYGSETILREQGDEKLNAAIEAETARAQSRENDLVTAIQQETERAQAAEEANANTITTETARAKAAEEENSIELKKLVRINFEDFQFIDSYYLTSSIEIGNVFNPSTKEYVGINSFCAFLRQNENIKIYNYKAPSEAKKCVITDSEYNVIDIIEFDNSSDESLYNYTANADCYLFFSTISSNSYVIISNFQNNIKITDINLKLKELLYEFGNSINKLKTINFDSFSFENSYYSSVIYNEYEENELTGKVFNIFKLKSQQNWKATFISIRKGERFVVNNCVYGTSCKYQYLIDKLDRKILKVFTESDFEYTAETDSILAVSTSSTKINIEIDKAISKFPYIEKAIEEINNKVNCLNLNRIGLDSKYIDPSGLVKIINNNKYFVSRLIKINGKTDTLNVSFNISDYDLPTSNTLLIAFYDTHHQFVQGINRDYFDEAECKEGFFKVSIPNNAKFILFAGICDKSIYLINSESLFELAYINEVNINKIMGFFLKEDGKSQSVSIPKYYITDYIKIDKKSHYWLYAGLVGGSAPVANIVFYSNKDENTVISSIVNEIRDVEIYDTELSIPDGTNYVRFSSDESKSGEYLRLFSDRIKDLTDDSDIITDIVITRWLDIPINKNTDIFFDAIINEPDGYKTHPLIISGSGTDVLKIGDNQVRFSPTETGTSTLVFDVYNDINLELINNSKFLQARRIPTNIGDGTTSINICFCGDSLLDGTAAVCEAFKLLNEDGDYSINQIGTRTGKMDGITYYHEGRGSWTWEAYLNPKYESTELAGKTNAFMINGELNFIQYMENNFPEIDRKEIDYFIIALGTNDINRRYSIDDTINRAKTFIDSLLSSQKGFPNCKVAIGLPGVGAPVFKGLNNNMSFKCNIMKLNKAYIDNFDNGKYNKNVTCVMHGAYIDRYNGYQYQDVAINDYTQQTTRIWTDNLHPSINGYKQWSRGYYGKIRAFLYGML